jgi:hypothetical protein
MASLVEDIKMQSDWIIKAFSSDGIKLDYSIRSFKEIDRFFLIHSKNGKAVKRGRLSKNTGPILFSIGAYVGETLINTVPGTVWQADDNDPQGELNVSIKFPDASTVWPIQKVIKRFQNGSEDSIYVYGHHVTRDFTKDEFDSSYWDMERELTEQSNKSWWKFW